MYHKIVTTTAAVLLSCITTAQSAMYHMSFQGTWNPTDHPTEFPSGAHFTRLAVTTHHDGVTFWQSGSLASPGVELVAELGITSTFANEVNDAITDGTAASLSLVGGSSFGPTALVEANIQVTNAHSLVSMVSMVAPSPDWFVGVSGLSLINTEDNWIDELAVPLYAYDAGTEDGDGFSLSNPDADPQVPIMALHGPNADEDLHPFVNLGSELSVPPLATLTFTLIPEPTTACLLCTALLGILRPATRRYTSTDN